MNPEIEEKKQARQKKHLEILESIDKLERSISRLESFANEIENNDSPKFEIDKPPPPNMSLITFLETQSQRLNTMNSSLADAINKIREMIF